MGDAPGGGRRGAIDSVILPDTLDRTLRRIAEQSPQYAHKLEAQFAGMDAEFFDRAERFLASLERFLIGKNRTLEYGVDCHLRLCESMKQERLDFLRTGRYANTSFAEVARSVYANPEIMEVHMYGLVFSQFLWIDQYARLEFFCKVLPTCRDRTASYLEIGGGHGIYVASAAQILHPSTLLALIDISPTSMELARAMSPERVESHLCDVFDFPARRTYDLIVAGEVLEHLEEPRRLLSRIRELLVPSGRAFISTPVNAPAVDHIYLFNSVEEIRDMLRSEAFVIEYEATRHASDASEAQARKLKIPQMYAALVAVPTAARGIEAPRA